MYQRFVFICGVGLGLLLGTVQAQTDLREELPTIAVLEKRIKAVESNSELAPNLREKILQYFKEAVVRIEISLEHLEKAERLERNLLQISEMLRTIESRLAKSPTSANTAVVNVESLSELEHIVETRTKQLDDSRDGLRQRITNLETELALWRTRPEELVKELAEVEDRLLAIEDEMNEVSNSGEPRELLQAHQVFLLARRQRAENERRALQAEVAWFQSANAADLVQAQRELASRELAVKIAELELLQAELSKRRGNQADQRVRQTEEVVAQTVAELQPVALENLQLAKERRDVTLRLQELEQRHESTTHSLLNLEKEFKRTQGMVKDIGLTDSIGLLLRQQRAKLLDPRGMRSNLLHRNDVVRETRMRLFQIEADRLSLVDLDAATERRVTELRSTNDPKSIAPRLKLLLADQRQLIKGLDADYARFFQLLVEMDNVERRLLDLTVRYADYVDERVLWIRTGQTFGHERLLKATSSTHWISDPVSWRSVAEAASKNVARLPFSWAVSGLAFVAWLCLRSLLKKFVQRRGLIASETNCRELSPTVQSVLLTLSIASGWPSLIWFLGWRLDHSASTVPFVHAVAAGLLRCATFALPLEILRVTCMKGGLAERHFDWPKASIVKWRRNLGWYLALGLVLVGLIGLTEGIGDEQRLDSFGRFMFMIFASLSAGFCQLTVRRPRKETSDDESREPDEWSDRFWRFSPMLAVVAALGLLALGWTGYFYTALQLTWRIQNTAWLLVSLLLLRATVRRWISLERRRMAVLQDEELQSITEAGLAPGNAGHNPFLFPRWTWPDFRLNLTQIVTQMRRLLDTGLIAVAVGGLWLVWADVTPALNIFDRVVLWRTPVEQIERSDETDLAANSLTESRHGQTVKRLQPVTAADLGMAMLIVVIAVIAGRNIPGLVEVILLEHLAVDAGVRFAATCLVRYAIFVIGVCLAFNQIRIGWNNVQWLVAAASVGLGFGLQEIFANFVSGIILLFERPMRVGDVVTVGDTTGTVSRIRFRATTIVDGDRKELIVPNKEFITGKLLNWTLSDRVNRFAVTVVVGSGNDPQKVRSLLLEIASQHPTVLKEPAPSASLEDMNGGLKFVLRAFLPTLDGRMDAINDLYTNIHKRFEAEEIEMPRTSQDVFLHTDQHEGHSASPPRPHQPLSGASAKKWST